MRVVTARAARAADRAAARAGVATALLMEQAGRALADAVLRERARTGATSVVVLAGAGSNGGDGIACARVLADRGVPVWCLVPGNVEAYGERSETTALWVRMAGSYAIRWASLDEGSLRKVLEEAGDAAAVVDAVLGTGLHGALRPEVAACLGLARQKARSVVACDLPSGVDPDTGRCADGTIAADLTVTMGALKPGLLTGEGLWRAGRVEVAMIGLTPFLDGAGEVDSSESPMQEAMDPEMALRLLPKRPATAHKGTSGRVVIWAGSPGLGGAAVLATIGAVRTGAGLVTAVSTAEVRQTLLATLPQAMSLDRAREEDREKALHLTAQADAVVCGPGLGVDEAAWQVALDCLAQARSLVVDADALNAWAALGQDRPTVWRKVTESASAQGGRLVLTPHPGEAARLLAALPTNPHPGEATAAWVVAHPAETALRLARETRAVVVLKGHPTVTADPAGRLTWNRSGGPILATGGSGDLLTGMLAALLGQGLDGYESGRLGVYLHGVAADLASAVGPDPAGRSHSRSQVRRDRGVAVTELAAWIPEAIAELGWAGTTS